MRAILCRLMLGLCLLSAVPAARAQAPAASAPDEIRPYLVALSVPDLDASIAWYTDNLGFRTVDKKDFPDHKLRLAILERDGFRLELVQLGGSKPPAALLPGYDNPALLQGFGKLAFLVRDVDTWAKRLKEKGVKFQLDIREDKQARTKSFIVLDRDGNWVQFVERV